MYRLITPSLSQWDLFSVLNSALLAYIEHMQLRHVGNMFGLCKPYNASTIPGKILALSKRSCCLHLAVQAGTAAEYVH